MECQPLRINNQQSSSTNTNTAKPEIHDKLVTEAPTSNFKSNQKPLTQSSANLRQVRGVNDMSMTCTTLGQTRASGMHTRSLRGTTKEYTSLSLGETDAEIPQQTVVSWFDPNDPQILLGKICPSFCSSMVLRGLLEETTFHKCIIWALSRMVRFGVGEHDRVHPKVRGGTRRYPMARETFDRELRR